jgi:adenylosuccinate synthase
MKLMAVIGANYGDEGKGRTVDYLSNQETLVVRFNGGAQAGHTVTKRNGTRHIFHHIGSGTFKEAGTYLSRFFIVNPLVFVDEYEELRKRHGVDTRVIVDPMAFVTTPYDMMLNRAAELQRGLGTRQHGSCGMGINETVHRCTESHFMTYMCDFAYPDALMRKLKRIREEYVPRRMLELGLPEEPQYLRDENILRHFVRDCAEMRESVESIPWDAFMNDKGRRYRNVVFEGAQGLLLDEFGAGFPHVTRSRTGLTNIETLIAQAGLKETLEAYYVTRPYLTRHGAGPLPGEIPGPPSPLFEDTTNVHNIYQGSLRFGTLVVDNLVERIQKDLSKYKSPVTANLSVTCIDHYEDRSIGRLLAEQVKARLGHERTILCDGPLHTDTRML